ncbi:hypothetical protein PHMEG_00023827 [Phytophthora megakarya]|uniref:Uncharacterized protein n=1 Tax=Phytophthora megakarya TaxID=4795 RepID=A0A225VG53_9STRA|nr:hypothetical protein PHMEG_00023827 [Phytophthora megakarya]
MADEVATLKRELEELKLQLELERKKNVAGGDHDIPPHSKQGSPQRKVQHRDKKAPVKNPRVYVHHAAVGTRRGKWYLRDRQVLSRTAGEVETLKVRETWVWSGRTVILDKIVRLDEKEDEQGEQTKPEQLKDADMQQSGPVEVAAPSEAASPAAQPSEAVETSEAVSTAGVEGVDSNVEAKAEDEVRDSSAPASVETKEETPQM